MLTPLVTEILINTTLHTDIHICICIRVYILIYSYSHVRIYQIWKWLLYFVSTVSIVSIGYDLNVMLLRGHYYCGLRHVVIGEMDIPEVCQSKFSKVRIEFLFPILSKYIRTTKELIEFTSINGLQNNSYTSIVDRQRYTKICIMYGNRLLI